MNRPGSMRRLKGAIRSRAPRPAHRRRVTGEPSPLGGNEARRPQPAAAPSLAHGPHVTHYITLLCLDSLVWPPCSTSVLTVPASGGVIWRGGTALL